MNPELEGLLARHLAGELNEADRARLLQMCREDAGSGHALARLTVTERALAWLHIDRDPETFTDEVLARLRSRNENAFVENVIDRLKREHPFARVSRLLRSWSVPLAAAAIVVVAALWSFVRLNDKVAPAIADEDLVARITGAKDCQWVNPPTAFGTGTHLHRGQRLQLTKGYAEITFDCGAQIVLEGPASCELDSAWDGRLHFGALRATVPPEAIGFRIASDAVEVVDLGTEFAMVADRSGSAEVVVLKGAIEAAATNSTPSAALVLHEKEARRFAASGVSTLSESEQEFSRFVMPVKLEREKQTARYVHWSFDEAAGDSRNADTTGLPSGEFNMRLVSGSAAAPVEGRWQRALHFDNATVAKADLPGVSANSPRTILVWVNIPKEAQLSDAYAMLAWRADSEKLGSRAVHIAWNRNPSEGVVGALRTDFARGYAIGSTPLRDGRWHHLAVVFVPGARATDPVQVKQYVDGRLEGSARKPVRPGTVSSGEELATAASDAIWLGCRLGSDGPRKERFRGDLDELFIADRALTPQEIVHVMMENQPPDSWSTNN